LLANIGLRGDGYEYEGGDGRRFFIFPGSALFEPKPRWVMAAEIVETTKLYARMVARIQPEWIEDLGAHVLKRSHSNPRWEETAAHVAADERVSLYGLTINPKRKVHFGPIDPKMSREIFIRAALVDEQFRTNAPFFRHNHELVREIESIEAKARQRDVLVGDMHRYEFYDKRIPKDIHNGPAFEKWRRQAEREQPQLLFMTRDELMAHDAAAEGLADGLMAETDTEKRHPRLGGGSGQRKADARLGRIAGPRGQHDPGGAHAHRLLHVQRIVAAHDHFGP